MRNIHHFVHDILHRYNLNIVSFSIKTSLYIIKDISNAFLSITYNWILALIIRKILAMIATFCNFAKFLQLQYRYVIRITYLSKTTFIYLLGMFLSFPFDTFSFFIQTTICNLKLYLFSKLHFLFLDLQPLNEEQCSQFLHYKTLSQFYGIYIIYRIIIWYEYALLEFKETHLHRINSMYIFYISFYEIAIALELLTTLIMSGIEYSKET